MQVLSKTQFESACSKCECRFAVLDCVEIRETEETTLKMIEEIFAQRNIIIGHTKRAINSNKQVAVHVCGSQESDAAASCKLFDKLNNYNHASRSDVSHLTLKLQKMEDEPHTKRLRLGLSIEELLLKEKQEREQRLQKLGVASTDDDHCENFMLAFFTEELRREEKEYQNYVESHNNPTTYGKSTDTTSRKRKRMPEYYAVNV